MNQKIKTIFYSNKDLLLRKGLNLCVVIIVIGFVFYNSDKYFPSFLKTS